MAEVLARVRSVLRRLRRVIPTATVSAPVAENEQSEDDTLQFEGLVVNNRTKSCTIDGQEIQLTRKEFDILGLLLSNRDGHYTSFPQICEHKIRLHTQNPQHFPLH